MDSFFITLDDNYIKCILCPQECKIKKGFKGLCGVRKNENGSLKLLTYGKISGLQVDPIEKKPLYHFYPGSQILSFGSIGCNLNCKFCQNYHISKNIDFSILSEKIEPELIALEATKNITPSVAFTYNEPIIAAEYIIDVSKECKKRNIKTVAVTNGYVTKEALAILTPYIDAYNVDLKSFNEEFYEKQCGGELQPVLNTLVYLKEKTNSWVEITNLIIPGLNDNFDEIEGMLHWLKENIGPNVPLHFSAFHPAYKMKDRSATQESTIIKAVELAYEKGLKFVYGGNIYSQKYSNTYCPKCGKLLIERDYYKINSINIENNQCKYCKEQIEGIY